MPGLSRKDIAVITSPPWLRYLPASLRAKIEHHPNMLTILGNTGWLFFDRIVRMGMGVFVGVWVARYLGPQQFGLLNYALAVVSLFTAVASLGLNNIVVRDLVQNPQAANPTLGTAFVLQLIGGAIAFALAVIAVILMRPGDATAKWVVAILSFAMVFKSTDVVKYWFESKVQSKYTVWVENAAFLIFAAIKVVLILSAAPFIIFVWIVLAEALLVACLLLAIYAQQGHKLAAWRYQYARAKSLFHDSWPLILSGIAAMIYMRIDQIMLGQMLGDEAVGIYSAAVRLSEVWYFIPIAIAGSVFPAMVDARKTSTQLYYSRLKKLFNLLSILAVSVAVPISLSSGWLMDTLYGPGYGESAAILVIHVWTGIFVFSGVAGSRWFIAENLQKYTIYRTLAGAGVCVLLNILLIPRYGPIGAAWGAVLSQAVASVFFNALNAETRVLFWIQIKALTGFELFRQ